jgi:hypothetical protein
VKSCFKFVMVRVAQVRRTETAVMPRHEFTRSTVSAATKVQTELATKFGGTSPDDLVVRFSLDEGGSYAPPREWSAAHLFRREPL